MKIQCGLYRWNITSLKVITKKPCFILTIGLLDKNRCIKIEKLKIKTHFCCRGCSSCGMYDVFGGNSSLLKVFVLQKWKQHWWTLTIRRLWDFITQMTLCQDDLNMTFTSKLDCLIYLFLAATTSNHVYVFYCTNKIGLKVKTGEEYLLCTLLPFKLTLFEVNKMPFH